MRKELQDKLYEAYPTIFKDRTLTPMESCMAFGIDCGSGWYQLLDNMCALITSHIEWNKQRVERGSIPNGVPDVIAEQVKEKFGTLRFYYRGGDETISGIVRMAESMSGYMCETCGNKSEVREIKGWLTTCCDPCLREKK